MEQHFMILVGAILLPAMVICIILQKISEHLAAVQRLLERANDMKREDRTGEWRH